MQLTGEQYDALHLLAGDTSAKFFKQNDHYYYCYQRGINYTIRSTIRIIEGLANHGYLVEVEGVPVPSERTRLKPLLGIAYSITDAGRNLLETQTRPLTTREVRILRNLAVGHNIERDIRQGRFRIKGKAYGVLVSSENIDNLFKPGFITTGKDHTFIITDLGRKELLNHGKKTSSLSQKQRFVLKYLQEHSIAYFVWQQTLQQYRILENLEEKGFVKPVSFPDHIRRHSGYSLFGHSWQITNQGREVKISRKLSEGEAYSAWLSRHLEEENKFERLLKNVEVRIAELKEMPYQEYLKTVEWKNKRKQTIERANYRCQECGHEDEYTLHVHHKTYVRRGNEELDDLVVLCGNCHAKVHDLH